MKRIDKVIRIIHSVLCVLNLGSIFYALMVCSIGTSLYAVFRRLSLAFSIPLLFMRFAYLQYIVFGVLALFTIIKYIVFVKNKEFSKRNILVDIVLWIIAIIELIYLENAFESILWF